MSIKTVDIEEKLEQEREEEDQPMRIMGVLLKRDVDEIRTYLTYKLGQLGCLDEAIVNEMVDTIVYIASGIHGSPDNLNSN